MIFTIANIINSIAGVLRERYPDYPVYDSPNQQGTETPCMFLQQRYSYIKVKTAGRFLRQIGLALTYLVDYNLPNMQQLYQAAAEQLDMVMETFPYTDGTTDGTALLRTYEREWRIDLDAMHYKFELQVWVDTPDTITPMETMNYQEAVTDGS